MIDLYEKEYDALSYNCAHFASDVWERLTGRRFDFNDAATARSFRRVAVVQDPCVVVLRRKHDGERHIGVWWAWRVWHLRESGMHRATLAQLELEYGDTRYYACSE